MERDDFLLRVLNSLKSGEISVEEAASRLRDLPYEDIGFCKIDHHRTVRTGFPEVVFCQGKTVEQVVEIVSRLASRNPTVLATRATEEQYDAIRFALPHAEYNNLGRIVVVRDPDAPPRPTDPDKYVMIVSAGTADIPVAEEAAVTCEAMGSRVEKTYDIGVAGIHRLLDQRDKLTGANVIVVVAGMEGALASVVGGMVDKPVIGVPTSIGYGASFQGLAALLSMLNSCAEGVAVVNIDNGFGAGYFAHIINR